MKIYYIAPELLHASKNKTQYCYTEKSDIWSIGVILYQMVTKKKPFNGKDFQDITENILYSDPDFTLPVLEIYTKELRNLTK